jgi:hypothetical protein
MAIVDKQKVDLLYKKLFGVAKTDFNTLKGASNEVIPSPALIRGDTVWTQANSIIKAPAAPAAVANVVEYRTVECVPDNTTTPIGGVYPTWIAKTTGGSPVDYKNWIPPEFGPGYLIEVFIGDPGSGGTKIFDAGINDKGAYYFDYMAGVLNFTNYLDNGSNANVIPNGLSGNSIWIRGYRYIGFVGITDQQEGKFGNLQLIDNTIHAINVDSSDDPDTGDVIIKPRLDGFVRLQGSRVTQHASDATTGYDSANPYNTNYEKTSLLARGSTLNGQEVELTLDGLSPSSTNRFYLTNYHSYKVNVNITAKLDGGTESAIWNIDFLAYRGANASTTAIIGNTITEKVAGSPGTKVTTVTVAATALVAGKSYKIKTLGTTNWGLLSTTGPTRNYEVGTVFVANSTVGTGDGIADEYLTPAEILINSWTVKAEADTNNGSIKILVRGPDYNGVTNKTIKWLAAINTLDIYEN